MSTMKEFLDKRKQAKTAQSTQEQPKEKSSKTKTPPGKKQAVSSDLVTFKCGCKASVGHISSVECRACFHQTNKERKRQRREKTVDSKIPRLPDKSEFHVTYDSGAESWIGTLKCGEEIFSATETAVFRLLSTLDRLYRASLNKEQKPNRP